MAQPEVALHLLATQIDVAILEADLFVLDRFFGRREGSKARVVENAKLNGFDLDFAGRHLGVDRVSIAEAHFADSGDDIFRADLLAFDVAIGGDLFIKDNLGDAASVAEVEEDEVTVVAAAIDPAHEDNGLTCLGGAQSATHVGAFESTEKVEHYGFPFVPGPAGPFPQGLKPPCIFEHIFGTTQVVPCYQTTDKSGA